MKPLPEEFDKKGFHYRRLWREGEVAIYEQSKGPAITFETIVVREQNATTLELDGVKVDLEHREIYPSSEQWGTYGWTTLDAFAAMRKARQVIEERSKLQ